MPAHPESDDTRDRIQALVTVCVLAVASLVIAFLGAVPARVSATELMGDARAPEQTAFVVSHRGGGALAPENTLPAVSAALEAGLRLRRGRSRAHRRPGAGPDARQEGRPARPTAAAASPTSRSPR